MVSWSMLIDAMMKMTTEGDDDDKESYSRSKLCVLASVHFNSPGEDLAGLGGT